jgi:hypothetical protein
MLERRVSHQPAGFLQLSRRQRDDLRVNTRGELSQDETHRVVRELQVDDIEIVYRKSARTGANLSRIRVERVELVRVEKDSGRAVRDFAFDAHSTLKDQRPV